MQQTTTTIKLPPLTVRQAADVLQRSTTWVRNWIGIGVLQVAEGTARKPMLLTGESVAELASQRRRGRDMPQSHLRLVVDNTK